MNGESWDTKVRLAAFRWLDELAQAGDDVLHRGVLQAGFALEGQQIHLMSPQGIFTPSGCRYPLSSTTVMNGPYADRFEDAHRLSYRCRGLNPDHQDNVGLRSAMRDNVPLVHFFAIAKGRYQAIKPVYVTGDNLERLTFTIMADVAGTFEGAITQTRLSTLRQPNSGASMRPPLSKCDYTSPLFANACWMPIVLIARCAVSNIGSCWTRRISSRTPIPRESRKSRTACRCARLIMRPLIAESSAVRPDYVVQVRADVLTEEDGPMLKYGQQSLHGSELFVPIRLSDKPSKIALERRYQEFVR